MATAEKRVVTDATGQAMLAELRKIPGVMNPVPVEKGGTGVTTPEEILELINAEPKLPVDVVEELGLRVKSVNGNLPDEHGDVRILHVSTADNLSSDESTVVNGTFIERTTGGDASIQDGPANLGVLYGYSIRTGYTAENKRMEVIPVGRLDDSVVVSAEINWNTFKTAVNGISTNKTFTYTTAWNENPETYGITVSGTPVSGDVINVYFIAENRGTITNTTPETFVETNWNLYDSNKGYAKVMKYSDEYGFMIGGTYTGIGFSETVGGTQIVLTPDSNGHFQVPSDGYVYVTGGDEANTYILMTWSDWGEGYTGEFLKYEESVVDFSELMENSFPFGLCSIGVVSDEINFNDKTAYIRIERVAYSTENRINAEASDRAFVYDDDWIYQVKETPEKVRFNIDNSMTVFDHGIEFFTGTELPVTVYQLFGQNLKDKLRREVITVTPQNFSVAQKKIARDNIEAAWDPEVIKTINHKYPDQFGDITIVEGTANASYGLYRINAVIQPAAWMLVNGAYQVAYSDPLIKSDMDGMETWLDNPEVMLGKTRFSTIDGALIISTAVLPTETWNLHVALGTNGSTVLEQVNNKAEQNTVGLVENDDTAFHNISAGQYVIWKGALYQATTAITAGDTLAASGAGQNLSAKSNGIANEINSSMVHNTGDEDIEGIKSFIGYARFKNSATNPLIYFSGSNLEQSNATISAISAGASGGSKYGAPYFRFYEYSPSADGTTRTSYSERYELPAADVGLTENVTHQILTTKTYNVDIGNVSTQSSKEIRFTATTHMILIGMSGNTNRCYFGLVYGSTGTPVVLDIHNGSNITITPGTGKITIATAASYNTHFYGIYLDGRGGM